MDLFQTIQQAQKQLQGVISPTPLIENLNISEEFEAKILLKREDLQIVRSYKIRGAYNKMSLLTDPEKEDGIICASAGNHAQGVAFSCHLLKIRSKIYMPKTTPKQKVKQVGNLTFGICQKNVEDIILVPEGKVYTTILRLYNEEAMVVEPAGALTIAVLDFYKEEIKGKKVVCIVSGSNNDIERTAEIKERSLLYEGLMHYFMIQFPQRTGALKEFVNDILESDDDITYFQFAKKNSPEVGWWLWG